MPDQLKKLDMRKSFMLLILLFLADYQLYSQNFQWKDDPGDKIFNILDYGAVGDGITLNTDAINRTIEACFKAGGGRVIVPEGNYLTGTIVLKSNIILMLEENSTIIGTPDLDQYKSYIQATGENDHLSRVNLPNRSSWLQALILLDHLENVTITGTGTIDGANLTNPEGEEGRRGPHGILVADSRNITISKIRVSRSGNYNILGFYVEDMEFSNLVFTEGYDGIHIRKGKNIKIDNCKFYTRDDAIAGGYWEKIFINECIINSSCNGIRLIMPASDLEISNCYFSGPGVFGHQRGRPVHPFVTNSLTAIILQPGAWGLAKGDLENIYIHDIKIKDMNTALMFLLNEGNQCNGILAERIVATGINLSACSVESWNEESTFSNIRFKDISISFLGRNNPEYKKIQIVRPRTESRILSSWGWYVRNVKNIEYENISLTYTGIENRPVIHLENVGSVLLKNFNFKPVPDIEQMELINVKSINKVE